LKKKTLRIFDGSEQARRALSPAVYLARLSRAKLDLWHGVDLNEKIATFEQVSTGGDVPGEIKEEGYYMLAVR
jgi:hypothetical protein